LKKAGFKKTEIMPIGGYFWFLGNRLGRMPEILFKKNVKGFRRILRYIVEIPLVMGLGILILACYRVYRLNTDIRNPTFTLSILPIRIR